MFVFCLAVLVCLLLFWVCGFCFSFFLGGGVVCLFVLFCFVLRLPRSTLSLGKHMHFDRTCH